MSKQDVFIPDTKEAGGKSSQNLTEVLRKLLLPQKRDLRCTNDSYTEARWQGQNDLIDIISKEIDALSPVRVYGCTNNEYIWSAKKNIASNVSGLIICVEPIARGVKKSEIEKMEKYITEADVVEFSKVIDFFSRLKKEGIIDG